MESWSNFYEKYEDKTEPEKWLLKLVPTLKKIGVTEILDAGCGTGRNSLYLAKQGFMVHGIDISRKAIQMALTNSKGYKINYSVGTLSNLPYPFGSIDFIFANHSLEYGTEKEILKAIREFDRVLKDGRPIFLKVDSKEYEYNKAPMKLKNLAHIIFCINNKMPLHSFSEDELRRLFNNYDIRMLEHKRVEETEGDYIREFILYGLKMYRKW